MAHYPLNHHMRPIYRFLAALASLYLFLFGIIGIAVTWGESFFGRGSDWVLGLRTNPAAAWLATLAGIVLLAAVVLGGNLFHRVTVLIGWGMCAWAMVMLAMIQTDANIFNVSMVNVLTIVVLGLVVLTAGLYGKVGSREAASLEAAAAHNPR